MSHPRLAQPDVLERLFPFFSGQRGTSWWGRFPILPLKAESEIRMHNGTPIFSQSLCSFIDFSIKNVKRPFKTIDLGIAVISVFVSINGFSFSLTLDQKRTINEQKSRHEVLGLKKEIKSMSAVLDQRLGRLASTMPSGSPAPAPSP